MPQPRKYANDGERIAAFREREKVKRINEEKRVRHQQRQQAERQAKARVIAGQIVERAMTYDPTMTDRMGIALGAGQDEVMEIRAMIAEVGRRLSRGYPV